MIWFPVHRPRYMYMSREDLEFCVSDYKEAYGELLTKHPRTLEARKMCAWLKLLEPNPFKLETYYGPPLPGP